MKKKIILLLLLIVFIVIFCITRFSASDYSISYDLNEFGVTESYDKEISTYYYDIKDGDVSYSFNVSDKYSSKRKRITKINKNDYCISIEIDKYKSKDLCYLEGIYYINSDINNDVIYQAGNVSIYNNNYKYYIWNNYGLTNLNNNKNYNFINNEQYDNSLYYQTEDYIIFPDYNSKLSFNKFIIFDIKDNKYDEVKLGYDISYDSYILGEVDDSLYFFDTHNNVEYKYVINKKKIEKVSDGSFGIFYNLKWEKKLLKDFSYNNIKFETKGIKFINNNELYMKLYGTDTLIRITDFAIDDIIYTKDNVVVFIANNTIYRYEYDKDVEKLLSSFEWNFSYQGKIFIFN